MVDIVLAEAGPHQLLEEVGLFVRALGRAEAGKRVFVLVADLAQAFCCLVERDVPRYLFEYFTPVGGINRKYRGLGESRFSDERLRQALRMGGVVKTVAALHAEPVVVRRTILAGDE